MKLTRLAKAGLVLLALGLVTFLGVAIWLKSTRTILADIPMPMRAEVVSRDFTVDYDGSIYQMVVRLDGSVSDTTAKCLLGATKSELYPNLDCRGTSPLLMFSWELRRDGRVGANGSSANMGSISKAEGASRVIIVGFPAQKKHQYAVTLKFDRDARNLAIPRPRVQIELDSFVTEDLFVVGGILDSVASGLCFFGVVMFSVSFLRTKLNRSKTQPERV
jgi:hypothetical protein